jgi:RNA polymerase sigma-70 factor, ECF subfamily
MPMSDPYASASDELLVLLARDKNQQAFAVLVEHKGQALPAWLKTIAVHTWLKHLRRKDPLFNLARDAVVPEQAVENTSGMVLDLNRALAQLGEAVRLCVVLTYHEGLSHGAIAQITGLPLGTVKSHINRGSAQLRTFLAAYETSEQSS